MSNRVVVTDFTFPDVAQERAAAESVGASFAAYQATTDAEVAEAVAGTEVVAVQFAPFGPLACKAVSPGASIIRYGVGYDNIDLAAARDAGLKVGYVPDYCADEVADHTAAVTLTLLRKVIALDSSVRAGEWAAVKHASPMKPFCDTTFGFFGLGQIGQAVLSRLKAFGFRFIVADPELTAEQADRLGVSLVESDELLATADIVTLHVPATEQTTHYFNAERLSRMQPHAMIVNTARGQLIVEEDLATALNNGIIAAAALDVFHVEPLPENSALRRAPNLLLTPHSAWFSDAAIDRLQCLVATDITRALNGEEPRRPVRL